MNGSTCFYVNFLLFLISHVCYGQVSPNAGGGAQAGPVGPLNWGMQNIFDDGNDEQTIIRDREKELFIYLPEHESICYFKDLDEDDDDYDEKEEIPMPTTEKGKISKIMKSVRYGDIDDQTCAEHGPHYLDEDVVHPLVEACEKKPIAHIDQLTCTRKQYPEYFYKPTTTKFKFRGKKSICKFYSKSIAHKTCRSWVTKWWRLKNSTRACLWSHQFVSQITCKRDTTSYQSQKKYYLSQQK